MSSLSEVACARVLITCLLLAVHASAQLGSVSLDGTWDLLLDPQNDGLERGLPDGDHEAWSQPLRVPVPGALEVLPATVGYDGVAWYRTRSTLLDPSADRGFLMLEFDSANVRTDVWLDGQHLGRHDGADAPFRFDITDRWDPQDSDVTLVVRVVDPGGREVDGLQLGALPHAKESWYLNYGGLTGSVRVSVVPVLEVRRHAIWLDDDQHLRAWVDVQNHASVGFSYRDEWSVRRGTDQAVVATGRIQHDVEPGTTRIPIDLSEVDGADAPLERWSPETPTRHWLTLAGIASAGLPFGIRRFEVRGNQFFLNGEPRRLRGVLFQPYDPGTLSSPPTAEWRRHELLAIKAAGFDLVRAHIRVMPELYALCDEIGLLVQAEPTLGWITEIDEHTRPEVDDALQVLADEVAGHPSVVMIGLLNEMSGEIWPWTSELHARAHELMPNHLILDDSGSWQGSAHYWNPGADGPVPYDDVHLYRAWPWTPKDLEHAANIGLDDDGQPTDRLVFISEFGFGGTPSLRANVAGFGDDLHLEDAQEHVADLRAAEALIASGVLGDIARDVDDLTRLGQLNQARAMQVMTAALRRNPRLAGDCATQWRDASWECGAGLVDVWGHPKPVLAAMAALNAVAPDGPDDPTTHWPTLPARDTRPVAAGQLRELGDAQQAVLAPLMTTPGPDAADLPRLVVLGKRPAPWSEDNAALTSTVLRWVRDGGVALMLDAPDAGQPLDAFFFGYDGLGQVADLPVDLTAAAARGHFVGTHLAVHPDSALMADIPDVSGVLDERFGDVRPHTVLRPGPDVDARVELACLDGYGALQGGAVLDVAYGEGRLLLCTLRLGEEQLADPLARRVLENVFRWAADVSRAHVLQRGESYPPVRGLSPPEALAKDVGRLVWRHKIAFGLLERLTVQSLNGIRPRRDPPADAATLTASKNAALDLLLQGNVAAALPLLQRVEQGPLAGDRDAFLRKELELSTAFYRPDHTDRPAARSLGQTLGVGRHHARALELMGEGDAEAALAELDAALAIIRALDAHADDAHAETP